MTLIPLPVGCADRRCRSRRCRSRYERDAQYDCVPALMNPNGVDDRAAVPEAGFGSLRKTDDEASLWSRAMRCPFLSLVLSDTRECGSLAK